MERSAHTPPTPPISVWWVLWAAFLAGVCVIYTMLARPVSQPAPPESLPWLIAVVPLFLSAVIRWIVLPRFCIAQQALPLFVIGIALAEAACFLGIFIFPSHQRDLFVLSLLGILQFMPLFARRLDAAPDRDSLRGE